MTKTPLPIDQLREIQSRRLDDEDVRALLWEIKRLQSQLGYTGKQMAALACVGEQHWRKYTGGATPRSIDYANLFHMAAQLALSPEEIERVLSKMREIGAQVDAGPLPA